MEKEHFLFYLYSLVRYGFFAQVPKMLVLYSMGALMKMKLDKVQIHYCSNLILMPLAIKGDYPGLLKKLKTKFKNRDAELVVHPGMESSANTTDDYSAGRYVEYRSVLEQV